MGLLAASALRTGWQALSGSSALGILSCMKVACPGYSSSTVPGKESKPGQASSERANDAQALQDLPQHRRNRFEKYYQTVLSREMLLKSDIGHFMELPVVKRVDLSIQARDVHRRAFAEKWQMLLHGLGLEYITGLKPYFAQQHGKQFRGGNVSAARVTLRGNAMYGFLEKIALLALPNQVGFTGLSTKSIDSEGNLHFKLGNILNFPDYEENFDMFEDLKSVHVTIVLQNTSPQKTHMLLSGFHLPFHPPASTSDS